MRLTWQNLTSRNWRSVANLWKHGRAWLKRDNGDPIGELEWTLQLDLKHGLTHAFVDVREDDPEVCASVSVLGVALYVTVPLPEALIERLPFRFLREEYEGGHRKIGVALRSTGHVSWYVWADDHHWKRSDPAWQRGDLDLPKLVLGRERYEKREEPAVDVLIPLPEGLRMARATVRHARHVRARLPKLLRDHIPMRATVTLDLERPAWIPGKGENAHDIEDDGISSMTFPTDSIADAIKQAALRVMEVRLERDGGIEAPADRS